MIMVRNEDLALPAKRIKPLPAISNVVLQHEEWRSGQVQQVTWSSQGDVLSVTMYLYQSGDSIAKVPTCLEIRVENSGSSMITLPAGLLPGEYYLQVKSSESRDVTADSATFEVTCSGPPPAILNVALQQPIWQSGSQQQVTWSSQGEVPSVTIALYKSSNSFLTQLITLLGNRVENSGCSMITLPAGLLPGQYYLQFKSSESRDVTADSAAFEVTCSGPPPAISNVALQHEEWRSGQVQQVTWSSQGDVPIVQIHLYSGKAPMPARHRSARLYRSRRGSEFSMPICELQRRVENADSSTITLPAGLLPGKYHLKVKSYQNRDVTADSATFEVTCSGPPPAISSVAPQQPIWHSGSQQQVTWSCQGDVPTVHITLYKSSNVRNDLLMMPTCTLQHSAENSGRSVITVPTGLTPGKYHLEVQSTYNREVATQSADFTIDDEHRERCVRIGLLLLGLPPQFRLPYAIVRKIAVEAAIAA